MIHRRPGATRILAALLGAALLGLWAGIAAAETDFDIQPIPTPTVPPPPLLGTSPPIHEDGPIVRPTLELVVPVLPDLGPVVLPAPGQMTPARPGEPGPPQIQGKMPTTGPGADPNAVTEIAIQLFPGSVKLSESVERRLLDVAQTMKRNPAARVEVRAFSPIDALHDSQAHRLSLTRFLAVRTFLVDNGVDDSRIDSRALESDPHEPQPDRIELYIES